MKAMIDRKHGRGITMTGIWKVFGYGHSPSGAASPFSIAGSTSPSPSVPSVFT